MSEEPLQYMPMERWEELEKVFATDWPRSISAQAALQTQKQLETLGLGYGFKAYCPYGDPQNGIVAMNKKNNFNEIIVYCPPDSITKLENCLLSTKLIEWRRPLTIPFLPVYIFNRIERIAPTVNVEIESEALHPPYHVVLLDKKTPLFENITIPEDITFDLLKEDHVDTVDSVWINRYEGSKSLFKLLIKAKSGYGLFKNNALISSVFINEVGSFTHMYTFENYRNRGYGKTLLKLVCNEMLKGQKHVFGYCDKGNTLALKMYNHLGFQALHTEKGTLSAKGYGSGTGSKILTIHEAQGQTCKNTCIIRTKGIRTKLHDSIPHAVVAVSRHTHSCCYYTDDSDDADELMEIIVQCPDDDTTTLKTSLFTTKLIDWSDVILIPFMPDNIRRIVAEVAPHVNVEMVAEDTVPNQIIPEDVTIQPVSENDLEIVNSTWRNSYNGSMWLFDTLAKANFGYGVFKNHELVSWVFVNEVGALTHLYTLNEHRRMGFAEILLKQVCNTRLRENKNVFAYCRKGNTNACKLYEKLGFKAHHEVRWCFLKPKMELSK
ncbi:unnamed protein product [Chilo suppressalis]|uniref:N-acetyltransferase domain-containing protein n=1 Tax=Chilo suppressalis TaxID=168631 RepID=A0ABN8B236_CHISP|nr:unnamed protein product [Chilo suppressalis]